MGEIFALYLRAGIFGSVIILLILLLRLFLRKAPRRVLCLLWVLAAIRLLLPFQFESRLSLQPDLDTAVDIVRQEQEPEVLPENVPPADISVSAPVIGTDVPQSDPVADNVGTAEVHAPVEPMTVLAVIWLSAAGAAVIYMIVSYGLLKFKVREAVRSEDGVMECDNIRGAFLLGYLKPRIYLPFNVKYRDRGFIIAHERAHIARGDNWWKLLGFVCACLHWYNPLVWLAYVLLCRDIEMACDERVIRELNTEDRKAYSMALLNCGKSLSGISVCPVAFGEVSLKTRIKKVLSYRKPGLWITVVAFLLVAVTAVCFLTSPMAEALPLKETPEEIQEQTQPPTEPPTVPAETEPASVTTEHVHAYTVQTVTPTCTETGYDIHTCACGDQYSDNPVKSKGHDYTMIYPNANSADHTYEDIYVQYQCTGCKQEYWELRKASGSYSSVESKLTSYAASFGFNMNFTGSKREAERFAYSFSGRPSVQVFYDTGRSLVNKAYQYCIENGMDVTTQMCCVVVDLPSYSVDLISSTNLSSYTQSGSYSYQKYAIYVYVLAIPQATDQETPEPPEASEDTVTPVEPENPETETTTEPTEPATEPTESTEEAEPTEPTGDPDLPNLTPLG